MAVGYVAGFSSVRKHDGEPDQGRRAERRSAHSGQDRTESPPSPSPHPLDGGDSREPGMLGDRKAVGFDIGGNQAIQP